MGESIFRENIFKFLSPEDIFNLGECSNEMKRIVIGNLSHPLATRLQYLKTMKKYYLRISSSYDDIDSFQYMELSSKNDCECRKFHQRKNCVIIDSSFCFTCIDYWECGGLGDLDLTNDPLNIPCKYHMDLSDMIFDYRLCSDCYTSNSYCKSCANELDK